MSSFAMIWDGSLSQNRFDIYIIEIYLVYTTGTGRCILQGLARRFWGDIACKRPTYAAMWHKRSISLNQKNLILGTIFWFEIFSGFFEILIFLSRFALRKLPN